MAFKTFTAGAVLTASDVNTYLAKQAVVVCTSTTRPSSPPEGMTIYETDTDKMLTYTTSTTGWVPPWNMPWGVISTTTGTAQTGIANSATDLTGQTATFTAVANRRYRIRSTTHVYDGGSATAAGYCHLYVQDGTNTLNVVGFRLPNLTNVFTYHAEAVTTLTAGSHTVKIQADTDAGTIKTYVSTGYVLAFTVEDIGPSAAPA